MIVKYLRSFIIKLIIYALIIFAYTLFVVIINTSSIDNTLSMIYIIIDIIPFTFIFINYFMNNENNLDKILKVFIIAGLIQSILSIAAYLNTDIQEFFVMNILKV